MKKKKRILWKMYFGKSFFRKTSNKEVVQSETLKVFLGGKSSNKNTPSSETPHLKKSFIGNISNGNIQNPNARIHEALGILDAGTRRVASMEIHGTRARRRLP